MHITSVGPDGEQRSTCTLPLAVRGSGENKGRGRIRVHCVYVRRDSLKLEVSSSPVSLLTRALCKKTSLHSFAINARPDKWPVAQMQKPPCTGCGGTVRKKRKRAAAVRQLLLKATGRITEPSPRVERNYESPHFSRCRWRGGGQTHALSAEKEWRGAHEYRVPVAPSSGVQKIRT